MKIGDLVCWRWADTGYQTGIVISFDGETVCVWTNESVEFIQRDLVSKP